MAAGLGFKTFNTGDVLSASDTNGYLMQGVLVFASAAARDSAITSPQEGQFAYLKDTNVTTYYTGSAWANLDTTGMTNPMTTTGDTIYSSSGSTPARLGIGSTGQVLTVAGGVPSWATAGGGSLTLLSTTNLTGATVTISSISGAYKNLYVLLKNVQLATAKEIRCQFNGDTTSGNYILVGSNVKHDGTTSGIVSYSGDVIRIGFSDNNLTSSTKALGTLEITNYASTTTFKSGGITLTYQGNGGGATAFVYDFLNFGYVNSTPAAITSLSFFNTTSANFTAGTVEIYGVN